MIKYKKKSLAFTQIEILVGIVLLAMVSLVTGYLLISHFRLFANEKALIDIASLNKVALDEITNQIREGHAIVSTCDDCTGDTTSSTVLVLQVWPLDSNGLPYEPTGSQDYDYLVYRRDTTDNTKLIKKTVADPNSSRQDATDILVTGTTLLTFTYDNADPTLAHEVTVRLENNITTAGKTQKINQETKAVLRNK